MKRFLISLFVLVNCFVFGQDIVYIKVFAHLKIEAATFSVEKSTYHIIGDEKSIIKNNATTILKFTAMNDSVEVKSFETVYGRFKTVRMVDEGSGGEMKLKLVAPDRKQRIYPNGGR